MVLNTRGYYNNCGHRADTVELAFARSLWLQPSPRRDSSQIQREGCDTNSLQRSIKFLRNDSSLGIEEVWKGPLNYNA
jgi:hypothetical protein